MNQENKSNKKIIIIVVVLLICALIIFLLLKGKKSNNNVETSNSNSNSNVSVESNKEPNVEYDSNGPLLMAIEDVFTITGKGAVATGRIERGKVNVGDEVQIIGSNKEVITTTITSIEMYRKTYDTAVAGDNVGLLLKDLKKEDIKVGQVIAKPNSIKATKKFYATIDILSKEEGGKADPFENGQNKTFSIRTASVDGKIILSNGNDKVASGTKNVTISVELTEDVALEVGTIFSIKNGGRTIAKGTVTAVN